MKRAFLLLLIFELALIALSCGTSNPTKSTTSGLPFRALVSQSVTTQTGLLNAGLIIINASTDVRAPVGAITAGALGGSWHPGLMVESNNRQTTLVFSSTDNSANVVSNSSESWVRAIPLPGPTESMAISVEGTTGFAAVPTAAIPTGPPGGIVAMNLSSGGIVTTFPVPRVHYISQSADSSRLLAFSDDSNVVTVVNPFSIVAGQPGATCDPSVCKQVAGFDRPVFGFFSADATQAWILNCGPECGGTRASVQVLDLVNDVAGPAVPVPGGATVGFLSNQTLYVAGNPVQPGVNTCAGSATTAATNCGRLTIVDLPSMTVTGTAIITDGYHTRIDMQDGQVFIGSKQCTNIVPVNTGDEQRGCLTIFNTFNASVVFPPDNGDVTGLQPITGRKIFYVVEGGELRIYDTTTDKIYTTTSIDIFGQAVDVKLIDF